KEGYERLKNQAYEKATNDNYVDAMEIAHFVQGIDLLLGGHIHKGYEKVWEDPVNHTICMQNYGNGGNLGWLDLQIHMPSRSIAGYDYPAEGSSLLLLQEDEFWPDTSVANFIEEQQRKYEKGFKEVIGKTETALTRSSVGEAPMNNFLADVMRQRVDADFAFMNFGGIRSNIRKGPITREDIFKVLPFGNEIVVFEASGKLIKVIVEQKLSGSSSGLVIAGGKVVYNREYSDGQRVVYLEIKGESLDPDKKYRLATNDYLIEGNSGLYMLKDIPRSEVDFTGVRLREAVIQYIQENSPVSAEVDGRWKQDDDAKPSPEWIK
ncbi:multifunctional 2',3'-cyclic-nucleotide 2'-phosphodiesterase/5'-nucleotidase/3'-nucleotidase, partial [Candidatus Saccharibacteria bacterium]|nr:multifunctional 2',3'-cyclic-nucleotide 2'-phosphodiesterase/5'-nucleotidase/3'-nucleotidase [Candidatus Saccharibacteria bacterium]NIV72759.1 multifunctional 2',3'-cyclic-nucleotide 2'-phosphodiesterase/5'-nucleotidase/3'-nucleotidase [Calditrichia bacterium]NIV99931.1 multifunctional 2',3'-cyclic-nucleotide 2'-phosphodiesterase/5'-nucleotidase/3'-nucleotidase [Candidatus Saccharibacteria bacterium]NIW80307.1 multifunctional 2',3'-cyclic-nucleotide 2'-phosphodiesterase/5'-nucleotidase/3'-nuc